MPRIQILFAAPLTLLVICAFLTGSLQAEEARIWSDKSGKFEIRAKFIDVVEGKARLERPNGDITRISLSKLSEADQEYIRNGKQKPPRQPSQRSLAVGDKVEAKNFRKWEIGTVVEIDYEWERVKVKIEGERGHASSFSLDDLRWPGTSQQPLLIKSASELPGGGELKTVRPDMSDVTLLLAEDSSSTTLTPDPLSNLASSWKPKAVRLRANEDVHTRTADFVIAELPKPQALVLHGGSPFKNSTPPRIEMVDLRSRKSIAGGPAPANTGRLLLSPNGKRLVTFPGNRGGSKSDGVLAFWNIEGKSVSHLISFAPYVMNSWPDLDPEWVAWVDNDHLLTTNNDGQLILWEVEDAKAKYELTIGRSGKPILSHNREHLVIPTSDGAKVYDPRSGDPVATLGSGDFRNAALAFSPSGRQLAAISHGFIDVIDVTTGAITRSFPCQDINNALPTWWVNEEYLFVSNSLLVNVPRRIVAWKFKINTRLCKPFDGKLWMLEGKSSNNSIILSPMNLLAPVALEEIRQLDDEKLLAVRPGASISIDVKINDSLLAKNVQEALTTALEESGMQVEAEQPLRLVAKMKTGKTEKVNYRPFHSFGRDKGETINVTSRIYELQLQLNGVPIWNRTSHHAAPHHIRLKKGETTRAAISRLMKPRPGNFRGRLPTYVVRPEYQEPLGTSTISASR